jgi:colanic acid/amylovoran biosynthesis glycosyltransferase
MGCQTSIAYLVSVYPKVSHTFVRREIHALERMGWHIHRFAARGWDQPLVDADDIKELGQTRFMLRHGIIGLLPAALTIALRRPRNFLRVAGLALRMSRKAERGAIVHMAYFLQSCWLAREILRLDIGHIHAHFGTNPTAVAMLANGLTGIPYSFTVHGPEEFDKPVSISLREKIGAASFVVAITSFCRGQLFRWARYDDWKKIKVVRCGVDRAFLEGELSAIGNSRHFTCVGRLCEQKGQALLVEAIANLRDAGIRVTLSLVGDGEDRPIIERLIDDNGLSDQVRITGWADAQAVRQHMLESRALVLTSFAEGLPVTLMEAMALGRPVLSTHIAGIPELVVDGKTGWLITSGSISEIVEGMTRCLETSVDDLNTMGLLARQRARELHDTDREAAKLDALLRAERSDARKKPATAP